VPTPANTRPSASSFLCVANNIQWLSLIFQNNPKACSFCNARLLVDASVTPL
jgi:hypothetical protein